MNSALIFQPIRDKRPPGTRILCFVISVALNGILITTLLVTEQLAAIHTSADRFMEQFRKELGKYRMIMIFPSTNAGVRISQPAPTSQKPRQPAARIIKPLATPDPRLLERLDSRLTGFIKDNPAIEDIFTREIVRDVDSRALNLRKLLARSRIEVRFEVNEEGRIIRRKIVKSSRVPSIDHLALELVALLENNAVSGILKGLMRISIAIEVDRDVSITLEAGLRASIEPEIFKRQVQNLLMLVRFALPSKEAQFFLSNLYLTTGENLLIISKAYEKEALAAILSQYYQSGPQN